MFTYIKRAMKLRRTRKEIKVLNAAAECLNKIRTAVPDDPYPGDCPGSGGAAIKEELKTTALLLDENLRSLLEDFPQHRS